MIIRFLGTPGFNSVTGTYAAGSASLSKLAGTNRATGATGSFGPSSNQGMLIVVL